MVDILFGQSYYLRFDPKLWDAQMPYPPLGTLYAASYMRQKGYTVALFDAMLAASEAEWVAALQHHQPRFAVLFEDNFNYLSKMCLLRMREAALTMVTAAKAQGCTVILCGADATDHADLYLNHGADFVLLGEGELTLGELLDTLTGRAPRAFAEILGLAWKNSEELRVQSEELKAASELPPLLTLNSQLLTTARRPDIRDLDSLPFPAWDLVDIPRYQKIWRARHGYYSMNLVTTRGCPYHCNWCAKPIWGQRYNLRSPENVVAEMQWLKAQFNLDHIWFADDILGLRPGWVERFGDLLQAANINLPFKCLTRADLVTESFAAGLARAGCQTVWMGAESGSQKVLDAMEKGDKVQDIYAATQRLRRHGIAVGFFLQFGYPGETWADIQLTLKLVRECLPDDIGISVSYPLPGTKFYDRVKAELGAKQNWVDSADLAMLYRGPFSQDFYRVLHRRVHHEFRLRRALKNKRLRAWLALPRYALGWLATDWQLQRMAAGS